MSKLLNKMRKRKGFTIVELVIVIAVIAILAAVLIPTFANVIQKAQESAALQRVTSAYKEALALALADDGVINAEDNDGIKNVVGGFTFEWTDSENAQITPPPDFGYVVSLSAGKIIVAESANLKVLSQNVRYANDINGNSVAKRFQRFKALIEDYQPDLIGTQEAKPNQGEADSDWIEFLGTLEGYAIIGRSRGGDEKPNDEWNAIMYKTDRFTPIDSGTFWLTGTPGTPSTIVTGDNGELLNHNFRICTWAVLLDELTGETIVFANTHLDDTNDTFREQQAEYLLTNLQAKLGSEYGDCTIYLTGDFNCPQGSDPYNAIINGGFVDSETDKNNVTKDGVNITFHDYWANDPNDPPSKIDFCFYKGNVTALEYEIITENYDDNEYVYVSDHYGVIATFQNNKSN